MKISVYSKRTLHTHKNGINTDVSLHLPSFKFYDIVFTDFVGIKKTWKLSLSTKIEYMEDYNSIYFKLRILGFGFSIHIQHREV